jgi:hypothetical protein
MDEETARHRVLELAEELRDWWMAGMELRANRQVWDDLAPVLTGDHGSAGAVIGGWYRDAVLVRCRRLLAAGKEHEESPRRTLSRLADVAGHVTVDVLADAWMEQGTALSRELVVEQVQAVLDRAESRGYDLLDPETVQADARRLAEDYRTIQRFTSRAVAHLDQRRDKTAPPTVAEVDRLIDDVLTIVQRYGAVIAGVHLDTTDPGISVGPTVRALELFDWRAYVEAVSDETHRRFEGTLWPPHARDIVAEEVRVRYEWPDADR